MTPRKSQPRRKPRPKSRRRIALVLGGGGLKGFAHIGVLQALAERKIEPTVYAGTSIGALIGAAAVSGLSISEMKDRARALRRRDLFRLNRRGMLLQRTNAASVYLSEPLREVCASVAPDVRFDELDTTLLVNTVELQRGSPLVWGLPGLRHVNVVDAVYASCALPGFFPPGIIEDRACVDGGVVDNLPVGVAGRGMQVVIAVDTGSSSIITQRDVAKHGFSAIYMRAATTMMHELQLSPLQNWAGPPMILIRPRVSHIGWFSFSRADELIEAGYLAAIEALELFDQCLLEDTGIFPRRELRITVDRDLCIGCTLCAALAPEVMAMDDAGKAFARTPIVDWSPADGEFVRHCPTAAISAAMLDEPDPDNPPLALEPTAAGEPRARHPA